MATDDYRVTIRLSPELYAQLEARGSHGQPLAAIIREALEGFLAQPQPSRQPLADMAANIAALQVQVEQLAGQLAALAAERQTLTAIPATPAADRQPEAASHEAPAADWLPLAATPATPQPPAPRPTPPAAPERPTSLPPYLLRIAEVAAEYDKLTLGQLANLLFTRGIYRARDRKTGVEKPVNRGTLQRWLEQARQAGVL